MNYKYNQLTFLHLAKAIIVIKFPGTPRNIKVTQAIDANVKSAGGYP